MERLKQPFVRGAAASAVHPASGLGLAIAERIARLHGGRIELLAREGGGLDARMSLPVPDA